MHNTLARMTVPIFFGIAFGLFMGCSTLFPSKKHPPADGEYSQKELEVQLERINHSLSDGTHSADTYYRKGYLLSELAQTKNDPAARSPLYREMHQSLKRADQLFDHSGHLAGKQKVDELLKVRWSNEHNQGVQTLQSDSTLENKRYELAAAHFNNATIILPDSIISYKLEARTYYQNNQSGQAISALEDARRQIDPLPSEVLEQLAFLYLETGQPDKAVSVYEKATSFSEENLNLLHGLANAYISADNHTKALELLDVLVENEPENIIYAHARGTELYFLGAAKIDSATSSPDSGKALRSETFQEIDSLFYEAETELTETLRANPGHAELEQDLAYFYTNSAAKYQELARYLTGDSSDKVVRRIEKYLQASIPLFVTLAEERPEEKTLWKSLYQVYSYLGMNEKAEEAQVKLNS